MLGELVIRYRWLIVLVSAVALCLAGYGVVHLSSSSDNRVFFSEDNPQLQALEAFEDTYSRDENAFIVLEPTEGTIFTRETLAAIEALTEAAWQVPYSRRVDSITNFQHSWADGDDLIVESLVENATALSDTDIERIERIALSDPLLVNRLISERGHVTGISVTTSKPGESSEENIEVALFVRAMAEEFRQNHPNINVYLTGGVIIDQSFLEATGSDMASLMPIMFLLMVASIAVLIRSISGTFATILVIVASALTAMGLAGWYGVVITPATGIAPVIILTLAVADCVHILSRMLYEMRFGKTKHEAIVDSLHVNVSPVVLTSLTTAVGFLTMNFSDVPPFGELGNIVAVGVTAAMFYSIFLLPAVMSLLPVQAGARARRGQLPCDHFARFIVKRVNYLLWAMPVLMFVLAAGLFRIEMSDDFIQYFDESFAVRRDSDFVSEQLTGLELIEHSLGTGEENGISDPDYLIQVEALGNWYRQQPEVMHVNSITDVMKRLNQNMHEDDPEYYRIPESRELAAQYLLLYEMSLPFGLDLNSQIDVDKSASRLSVVLSESSTTAHIDLETRANEWIRQHDSGGMFSPGTGLTLMWAHITGRNIGSMLTAMAVALVLISFILIFALRSWKIGLISLVPNLMPAIMAFGLWGLIVGRINLGVSIVAAMSMGIVVDDTVHFLSKYMRARREMNMSPADGVCYAFTTVGMAMITTSIVLFLGFMVLALSGFGMNSSMGVLTAIAIAFALVADFLFLPPLLIKAERGSHDTMDFSCDAVCSPTGGGSSGADS